MHSKQAETNISILTKEYLPIFLAFSHGRIHNFLEAEELAQEISFQCVLSLNREQSIANLNAYLWSIAHNTYKRWCARKKMLLIEDFDNVYTNLTHQGYSIEDDLVHSEEVYDLRLELSRLSRHYRNVLVAFYYENLSIRQISDQLGISSEMVKFYLTKGREKLKENISMIHIGEKSFHPTAFSIYKSAIDFSRVNVWKVFERLIPCQIAIICHETAKSISTISSELGIPSLYIEDEIQYLLDAGVMIHQGKDKFQTNFHILSNDSIQEIYRQFEKEYEKVLPKIMAIWNEYLSEIKNSEIFKHEVSLQRYAWFFMNQIAEVDYRQLLLDDTRYPQILSCGSKAFIFASESISHPWSQGATPTILPKCNVWACDVNILGEYHCQEELRDKKKAQALFDIYQGNIHEEDKELYAQLIEEGYITKIGDNLYCNIAVMTNQAKQVFDKINQNLQNQLSLFTKTIYSSVFEIVKRTIPEQLASYVEGYTQTWIRFYASIMLHEVLYKHGFVKIPEDAERIPVACYIEVL